MAATNFILVDPAAGAAQDAQDSSITEVGGSILIATNKFTVATGTGNTAVAGTLGVAGNVAVATNKFTVTAATGNTAVAGTLGVTGDVSINTNKFTVAASSGNTAVAGTLGVTGSEQVGGALFYTPTTVAAATHTVTGTDSYIHVPYTATGAVTITIPTAQVVSGRMLYIIDTGASAATNNITIQTEGAETISGEADAVINSNSGNISLQSNGTNWFVIG